VDGDDIVMETVNMGEVKVYIYHIIEIVIWVGMKKKKSISV
jgi:hypothetical protein